MDEDTKLKLMGLRMMADDLNKQLATISRAAAALVGEEVTSGDFGHSGDFAYDSRITAEELWERTASSRAKDAA